MFIKIIFIVQKDIHITFLVLLSHCYPNFLHNVNKIYREKSIPMTALWCPAFSNHG